MNCVCEKVKLYNLCINARSKKKLFGLMLYLLLLLVLFNNLLM